MLRTRGLSRILLVFLSLAVQTASAEESLWLRNPAISPDGQTVVFTYRGDLWRVPTSGGQAVPITLHEAYDTNPVWSPDSKTLAFASDRFGNYDVWTIPVEGGRATRLTFHSASDYPTGLRAGRPLGAVQLGTARCRQLGAVPDRGAARALRGRALRRHAAAAADDAGARCALRLLAAAPDLHGRERGTKTHSASTTTRRSRATSGSTSRLRASTGA